MLKKDTDFPSLIIHELIELITLFMINGKFQLRVEDPPKIAHVLYFHAVFFPVVIFLKNNRVEVNFLTWKKDTKCRHLYKVSAVQIH